MAEPVVPPFSPVPRMSLRHSGWTPARQKAFIDALAESGSPTRAARLVEMTVQSAYALRRHPQGGSFRAAWNAAVDCGIARLKDVALERAIEGELIPLFQKGVLIGFRRKHNDALLMFLLRQYGTDGDGRRVTVNYVRSRADAGGGAGASAEASTMTVRTTQGAAPSDGRRDDAARATLDTFEGVTLDAEAQAEQERALIEQVRDLRAVQGSADDISQIFIPGDRLSFREGSFEPGFESIESSRIFHDGSPPLSFLGDDAAMPDYAAMLDSIAQDRAARGAGTVAERPPDTPAPPHAPPAGGDADESCS